MPDNLIVTASDHAGYELKQELGDALRRMGYETLDVGTDGTAPVDYPDFGRRAGEAVAQGRAGRGVIVCGTGIGIAMAANRVAKVRAAVCHDVTSARLARRHNDANILALGARLVGREVAMDCLTTFLETAFEGGRHERRVAKLG